MSNKVIVYTKNRCPECEKTKFSLGCLPVEGVTIEYRNIEENEQYANELNELGFSSVPVTVFPDRSTVVGFEIGELQEKFGL